MLPTDSSHPPSNPQVVAVYNYVVQLHAAVWGAEAASPSTFQRTSVFKATCSLLDLHYAHVREKRKSLAGWKWYFFDRAGKSTLTRPDLAGWVEQDADAPALPEGLPVGLAGRLAAMNTQQ